MRAVGYFRPQRPDAAAGDDPLAEITRYCAEESHQLVANIPSERDGDLDDEARFRRLIDHFSGPDGRQALVIVPDSTHLAADLVELARRVIAIESAGGTVRCADPDSPDPLQDGLARLAMPGRAPGRQRQIEDAIMTKAARGEVIGRMPYGYRAGTDGTFVPAPEEARVVEQIFEWYLGEPASAGEPLGDGSRGIGFRRIAARLNEQGVRTRAGKRWSAVAVSGTLQNRAYIGTYNRRGMRLVSNHPPLVDRLTFNRAQEVMQARQPARRRRRPAQFILGGLLTCAACGGGVHGLTRLRKWRRADGSAVDREYRYYECPQHRRQEGDVHAAWRAEELERLVKAALKALVRNKRRKEIEIAEGSPGDRMARAGSAFLRQLRSVASGSESTASLAGVLGELDDARQRGWEGDAVKRTVDDLMGDVEMGTADEASAALGALVERIEVGERGAGVMLSAGV